MLNGLFDIDNRLDYLTENGDMLPRLKELVPWEKFRRDLEVIYDHERKSNAGRRPCLCNEFSVKSQREPVRGGT